MEKKTEMFISGSHGRAVSAASALPGQNNALADHYNGRRRAKALKPRFLTLTTGIRSLTTHGIQLQGALFRGDDVLLLFAGTTGCNHHDCAWYAACGPAFDITLV
jgi:hypothetical protein